MANLNESVCKDAEEAQEEEMCKNIEKKVMARLIAQFNSHWAQKEVALKNKLSAKLEMRVFVKIAANFNESVCNDAEEAREEEMCKNIEKKVTVRLTAQFNRQRAQKEVALKNKLSMEKDARKCERKKDEQARYDLKFCHEPTSEVIYGTS